MAESRLCENCKKPLKEEGSFCIYCGTKVSPAKQEPEPKESAAPNAPHSMDEETMHLIFGAKPEESPEGAAPEEEPPFVTRRSPEYSALMEQTYAPMGAWNICGTLLLFCLPVIGLIFAIAFACGACRKEQKKRLARGCLLFILVSLVLGAILTLALALFFWEPVLDMIRQALPPETWDYLSRVLPFLTA